MAALESNGRVERASTFLAVALMLVKILGALRTGVDNLIVSAGATSITSLPEALARRPDSILNVVLIEGVFLFATAYSSLAQGEAARRNRPFTILLAFALYVYMVYIGLRVPTNDILSVGVRTALGMVLVFDAWDYLSGPVWRVLVRIYGEPDIADIYRRKMLSMIRRSVSGLHKVYQASVTELVGRRAEKELAESVDRLLPRVGLDTETGSAVDDLPNKLSRFERSVDFLLPEQLLNDGVNDAVNDAVTPLPGLNDVNVYPDTQALPQVSIATPGLIVQDTPEIPERSVDDPAIVQKNANDVVNDPLDDVNDVALQNVFSAARETYASSDNADDLFDLERKMRADVPGFDSLEDSPANHNVLASSDIEQAVAELVRSGKVSPTVIERWNSCKGMLTPGEEFAPEDIQDCMQLGRTYAFAAVRLAVESGEAVRIRKGWYRYTPKPVHAGF